MHEFHVGPYETAVGDDEMLTEIRIPLKPNGGSAYEKVERRAGDWAVVSSGAAVWMDGDVDRRRSRRPCRCGPEHHVDRTGRRSPPRGHPVRGALHERGRDRSRELLARDRPARTAEYKAHLAKELTRRSLRRAVSRAQGQEA